MNNNNQKRDGRCLSLPFGLVFENLYQQEGLAKLDGLFLEQLRSSAPELEAQLLTVRQQQDLLTAKQSSDLITAIAPHLEDFIGQLFHIGTELRELQARHAELAPLYSVKRRFVQRKALTGVNVEQASEIDGFSVGVELETFMHEALTEKTFANHVFNWLEAEEDHKPHLALAAQYAAWATLSPEGKALHQRGVLFKMPHKLDMQHLVPVERTESHGLVQLQLGREHWRHREGFQLTDAGTDLTGALDQANYCIKCHNQGKDSCSTGLKEKDGSFKASVFGVKLAGCPWKRRSPR